MILVLSASTGCTNLRIYYPLREPGSDRTCETNTEADVLDRRVAVEAAMRGRHVVGTVAPKAAPEPTRRAGCAIQIVPLIDVATLIKRAVEAPAAAKRAYVSGGADGTIVVGLISTAADRGARGRVALRGVSPVAGIRAASLVVRRLVPLVLKWHPDLRDENQCWRSHPTRGRRISTITTP